MLTDFLPERTILKLASSYLAGRNEEEAIFLGKHLFEQSKISSTLDILGEKANSIEECQLYLEMYKNLVDKVVANPLRVKRHPEQWTISFKPSTFCSRCPSFTPSNSKHLDDAFERIADLVDYAFKREVCLTLEAEDHHWTEFQLRTYFALIDAGYKNLGTVLQTRLFRTAQDLRRFDERMRVRLVIGIYEEDEKIAYTSKKEMKDLLITYSSNLLQKGTYVELATHDSTYIEKFFSKVVLPLKIAAQQFETQFLLGVPRQELQKMLISGQYFAKMKSAANMPAINDHLDTLSSAGILVRLYLPFGADHVSGPYCKRRLERNPNLFLYGIKNIFGFK